MHWLVITSKRRWVAFVGGRSNDRMMSSGARGRGAIDGNASAGLVRTGVKVYDIYGDEAGFAEAVVARTTRTILGADARSAP